MCVWVYIYIYIYICSVCVFIFSFVKVLEGVAKVYPRALFYPLLMTKASSSSRRTEGDDDDAKLCRLTAMVFDPSAEAFAEV